MLITGDSVTPGGGPHIPGSIFAWLPANLSFSQTVVDVVKVVISKGSANDFYAMERI